MTVKMTLAPPPTRRERAAPVGDEGAEPDADGVVPFSCSAMPWKAEKLRGDASTALIAKTMPALIRLLAPF